MKRREKLRSFSVLAEIDKGQGEISKDTYTHDIHSMNNHNVDDMDDMNVTEIEARKLSSV